MIIEVTKTSLENILPFRAMFLCENNFQIRFNACHERGWTDSWLLKADGREVGYGAVKGKDKIGQRDAIFEFYVVPSYRKKSGDFFRQLVAVTGAPFIECQSNDRLLTSLLYEFADAIRSGVILFEDDRVTGLQCPEVVFRPKGEDDRLFDHQREPEGDFVLDRQGDIVATGGFMLHYNPPFADLYMEVNETCRRQGFGSFLVQELKRECYLSRRVPAARCVMENEASKATLLAAGLKIAGYMLEGNVRRDAETLRAG